VPAVVPDDAPLDAALDLLLEHDRGWLPVVDAKGDVLGTIDAKGLMRTYHEAEEGRFRPLDWSPAGTEVFDVVVDAAAPVVGLRLRDADFPSGMRVVAVERSSETVVADGDTLIASGDRLTITCTPGTRADAFWFFQGHDARIAHETYLDDSAPTQPGARAEPTPACQPGHRSSRQSWSLTSSGGGFSYSCHGQCQFDRNSLPGPC
jgi:hypothetical protein